MAAAKRSNNNLIIVVGLLTAVLGAAVVVVLLRDGGSAKTSSPRSGSDLVPVLYSTRLIEAGTAGKDMAAAVVVKQVPAVTRASDALTDPGDLADRTATVEIGADQQLRTAFFRQRTVRGAAIKIPDGKQAVAVTVSFTPAVAGYVGPGDHVNVYAIAAKQGDAVVPACGGGGLCPVGGAGAPTATARLVLPNVEVLDVSQELAPTTATTVAATAGASNRLVGAATITYLLAVDANQAERAIFFTRYAELYLTLVPKDQAASTTGGRDQSNALKP